MSDYLLLLPSEIFIDILIRLPVKTLLRCTSVCKSCYSLITSSYFITTHLNRNNNNANNQILLRNFVGYNCYRGVDHYSVYRDNETFDKLAALHVPFTCIDGCFRVIGSSNGLIFFSDDEFGSKQTMYLWNPSIRKFVTVPRPRVTFDSHFFHAVGFGFDAATNDYKIVRLVYAKSNNTEVPPEVELYELSTDSWRSINARDFKYVAEDQKPHVFLNGVIHWTGYEKCGLPSLIVSFDLKNEELGAIMLPPGLPGLTPASYLCVATVRDSLSLIHGSVLDYYYCIWVMKDYDREKSWTKEFTIDMKVLSMDAPWFFNTPFGFRDNGDVLLSAKSSHYVYGIIQDLVSYDPKSKQIKYLGVHGHPQLFYKDSYVESLVLVKGLSEVLGRKKISCDAVACKEAFISPKEEDDDDDDEEGGQGNERMKR